MDGKRYVLTFQDALSKFTLAVPIVQQDAMMIARAFVEEIILKFGIPQTILTDQVSNFMSEVFGNVCKLLKIKKIKFTAYHPQTNGALERTHRLLVENLRCFILEDQINWDNCLPTLLLCLTQPLTLPLGSPRPNYCSAGNPIYQGYYRETLPTLYTRMMTMLRNCNLVCSLVIV